MYQRKKQVLDGIDREIVRALYERGSLVSSALAAHVGMSPSAIFPRLHNLENQGIIRRAKELGTRVFRRKFGKKEVCITSPRSIFWEIDLIPS